MTEAASKVCPICQARNPPHAAICAACGASIADIAPQEQTKAEEVPALPYDFRLGETDLAESSLGGKGRILSAALVLVLAIAAAGAAFALLAPRLQSEIDRIAPLPASATPTRIAGPSVTPGPPTATFTPSLMPTAPPTDTWTPAPCAQTVAPGDSLIAIVSRCGHRNLEILPTVMQLNGVRDETLIQVGQVIIVPPPSPTLDPAATSAPAPASEGEAAARERSDGVAPLAFDPLSPTETPTLLPGLMWHIVQPDENMIALAVQYEIDAKALSDLNPEIEFALCDFSAAYGGPECTVRLRQGQRVRVPAPTPTITAIPTASGSETPTPAPTATFNAPIAQSPKSDAFFAPGDQVTLRWVATGRLARDEAYLVALRDTDAGASYSAETRELFFIVPDAWGPQDSMSHHFVWQIGVANTATGTVSRVTVERAFVWQGAGRAQS